MIHIAGSCCATLSPQVKRVGDVRKSTALCDYHMLYMRRKGKLYSDTSNREVEIYFTLQNFAKTNEEKDCIAKIFAKFLDESKQNRVKASR